MGDTTILYRTCYGRHNNLVQDMLWETQQSCTGHAMGDTTILYRTCYGRHNNLVQDMLWETQQSCTGHVMEEGESTNTLMREQGPLVSNSDSLRD